MGAALLCPEKLGGALHPAGIEPKEVPCQAHASPPSREVQSPERLGLDRCLLRAHGPSSPCLPCHVREGEGLGLYEAQVAPEQLQGDVQGGGAEDLTLAKVLKTLAESPSCWPPRVHGREGRTCLCWGRQGRAAGRWAVPGPAAAHPSLPSAVPNRSTFTCPYCGARNLDQQELVKHCVDNHRSDPNRVVSICSQPTRVPKPHCPPKVPSWDPGVGAHCPLSTLAQLHPSAPCSRCAPSARRCPGVTPATRAPTSCSTCSTGTSSPTTPLWYVSCPRFPRPALSPAPTSCP